MTYELPRRPPKGSPATITLVIALGSIAAVAIFSRLGEHASGRDAKARFKRELALLDRCLTEPVETTTGERGASADEPSRGRTDAGHRCLLFAIALSEAASNPQFYGRPKELPRAAARARVALDQATADERGAQRAVSELRVLLRD